MGYFLPYFHLLSTVGVRISFNLTTTTTLDSCESWVGTYRSILRDYYRRVKQFVYMASIQTTRTVRTTVIIGK